MCSFKANAGSKQSKQEKRPLTVRLNMGERGGAVGGGGGIQTQGQLEAYDKKSATSPRGKEVEAKWDESSNNQKTRTYRFALFDVSGTTGSCLIMTSQTGNG